MVEKEEELKLMLNENDYNKLKAAANNLKCETVIQINHYFDTIYAMKSTYESRKMFRTIRTQCKMFSAKHIVIFY